MDRQMWNGETGLWSDVAVVGGGESVHVPTLDGVLGALVTDDPAKAGRALDQLADPQRFAAPYGLNFVAREARSYHPDQYWRGSAWMQMNYLARLAALRWERTDLVAAIHSMSVRGALQGRFAEHWNPQTGKGHGAIPLTWSALVAAM
jgi:glycogen debranching enzyme